MSSRLWAGKGRIHDLYKQLYLTFISSQITVLLSIKSIFREFQLGAKISNPMWIIQTLFWKFFRVPLALVIGAGLERSTYVWWDKPAASVAFVSSLYKSFTHFVSQIHSQIWLISRIISSHTNAHHEYPFASTSELQMWNFSLGSGKRQAEEKHFSREALSVGVLVAREGWIESADSTCCTKHAVSDVWENFYLLTVKLEFYTIKRILFAC